MSRRNYHVEYRGDGDPDGAKDYRGHYFGRESRSVYKSLPKVKLMVVMVILTALCLFVLIFATLHLFLLLRLSSLAIVLRRPSMHV